MNRVVVGGSPRRLHLCIKSSTINSYHSPLPHAGNANLAGTTALGLAPFNTNQMGLKNQMQKTKSNANQMSKAFDWHLIAI